MVLCASRYTQVRFSTYWKPHLYSCVVTTNNTIIVLLLVYDTQIRQCQNEVTPGRDLMIFALAGSPQLALLRRSLMLPRSHCHVEISTPSSFCMHCIYMLGLLAGHTRTSIVHGRRAVAVKLYHAEADMLHLFVHQADVLLLRPDEDKSRRAQLRQGQGCQAGPWIIRHLPLQITTPACVQLLVTQSDSQCCE